MRLEGRLRAWNDTKGFGFIRIKAAPRSRERTDIFVHISEFENRSQRPKIGDLVSFDREQGNDGRVQDTNVILEGYSRYKSRTSWNKIPILFAAAIGIGIITPYKLIVLPALLIAINLLTIAAYRTDKRAAGSDDGRISEGTLLLLGLLGGWPAALMSQRMFRHKTSKLSFQWLFWGSVILNILAISFVAVFNNADYFTAWFK